MSSYNRNLILTTFLVLLATPIFGQQVVKEIGMSPMPAIKWKLPVGANKVEVPLSGTERYTLVPLSVSGSDTLWVTLDTGMPHPRAVMLWDRPAIRSLGLEFAADSDMRVMGAGGSGESNRPAIAPDVPVRVGDLSFEDMEVQLMAPMEMLYERDAGVIGAALFKNFVVELDYDDGIMRLHRPDTFEPEPGWSVLPMSFRVGVPFVDATVTLANGTTIETNLVLDLGAGFDLSLYCDSDDRIVIPDVAIETTLGRGLGGAIYGHQGRISSFSLAEHTLKEVTCSFPQTQNRLPGEHRSYHGMLGHGILARFNLIFDYSRNRLLLKPSKRVNQPFRYNTTGMFCKLRDNGYLVDEVLSASPAGEQGVLEGDRVVSINGREATSIPYPEMREILQQDDNRLDLVLDRNGETVSVSFTTRDLI